MPSCKNCGQKWKWQTIVLETLKLTNKVNCPYCSKTQYLVPKSKKMTGIFSYLPVFLIIMSTFIFDLENQEIFMLAAAIIIVFLGFYPFLMKLSNEKNVM